MTNTIRRKDTVSDKMLKRIKAKGAGAVFVTNDFLDFGPRQAVARTLSQLVRQGHLRHLARGLFHYPQVHPLLGTITPKTDTIADAVARRTGRRLRVSGAQAANRLGVSTQVPARNVFLTDGATRKLKIDNQMIEFRHTSPQYTGSSPASDMVVQTLRCLGADHITDDVIQKLRHRIPSDAKTTLKQDAKHIAPWMRPVVQAVAS